MQSLFERRRVESRWNGEAGFGIEVVGSRHNVHGDGCWAGAELEYEHTQEEGRAFEELLQFREELPVSGCASCGDDSSRSDDSSCSDVEADCSEEACGAREGSAEAY